MLYLTFRHRDTSVSGWRAACRYIQPCQRLLSLNASKSLGVLRPTITVISGRIQRCQRLLSSTLVTCYFAPSQPLRFSQGESSTLIIYNDDDDVRLNVLGYRADIINSQVVEALLYVHRNRRLIRDGSPGRTPRLSHSSWALIIHESTTPIIYTQLSPVSGSLL